MSSSEPFAFELQDSLVCSLVTQAVRECKLDEMLEEYELDLSDVVIRPEFFARWLRAKAIETTRERWISWVVAMRGFLHRYPAPGDQEALELLADPEALYDRTLSGVIPVESTPMPVVGVDVVYRENESEDEFAALFEELAELSEKERLELLAAMKTATANLRKQCVPRKASSRLHES